MANSRAAMLPRCRLNFDRLPRGPEGLEQRVIPTRLIMAVGKAFITDASAQSFDGGSRGNAGADVSQHRRTCPVGYRRQQDSLR